MREAGRSPRHGVRTTGVVTAGMAAALDGVSRVIVLEQTHSGQFFRYLRAFYDLPGEVQSFHRPGPLPMRPGEIASRLLEGRAR